MDDGQTGGKQVIRKAYLTYGSGKLKVLNFRVYYKPFYHLSRKNLYNQEKSLFEPFFYPGVMII